MLLEVKNAILTQNSGYMQIKRREGLEMDKKPRLGSDPLEWIRDTTEETKEKWIR